MLLFACLVKVRARKEGELLFTDASTPADSLAADRSVFSTFVQAAAPPHRPSSSHFSVSLGGLVLLPPPCNLSFCSSVFNCVLLLTISLRKLFTLSINSSVSLFVDTVIVTISKFKSLFKPIFVNFVLYSSIILVIDAVMFSSKLISYSSVSFVGDLGLINLPPHNLIVLSNNSVCEL